MNQLATLTEQTTFFISLEAGTDPRFTIDNAGLMLAEDITHDEFRQVLGRLKTLNSQSQVYLADAIRQGRVIFGDITVDQDLQQLEFDMPTMNTVKCIIGIPENERDDRLTPQHYVVLAKSGLTPSARRKWGQMAAEQNISPADLRASIPAGVVTSASEAKQTNHGVASAHGLRGSYDVWIQRVGGADGIRRAGQASVDAIIEELGVIADLVNELRAKPAKAK